jgi:hypothetical protein
MRSEIWLVVMLSYICEPINSASRKLVQLLEMFNLRKNLSCTHVILATIFLLDIIRKQSNFIFKFGGRLIKDPPVLRIFQSPIRSPQ